MKIRRSQSAQFEHERRPAVDAVRRTARTVVLRAHAPVDISSIVVFRIIFGAIMLWEVYRYFDHGWIARYWITPAYNFTYAGFEWVRPWPGMGMYFHFAIMGALAMAILLGMWYRVSAILFFLAFTYMFLLEKANYLNHFYFVSLIAFLMIFVPANRAFSLDARVNPRLRSSTAPAWALWLLRAQVGIIYFYGGLAKINADWLRGEPMRMWLAQRTDFPLIGQWFTEEWMISIFSYGGLLFDLLIVPALLWRRTRLFALAVAIGFHLTNVQLFNIGIFPWFTLAASILFFPPDLPRRVTNWVTSSWRRLRSSASQVEEATIPPVSGGAPLPSRLSAIHWLTTGLVGLFILTQMTVPLRHHLYPGNVAWSEEGHRFSWRMKLRAKTGHARFFATDPGTRQVWEVDPHHYLTPRQFGKMATQPDMIMQFSHHLAREIPSTGDEPVEIRAEAWVSLNGRPPQLMIDPTVDLTTVNHGIRPKSWVLPLDPTLRPGHSRTEDASTNVE
jgi:vitamin K-dependent gamma-carboxylase